MYNLLISFAAAVAATVAFGFLFGFGDFSIVAGIIPGILILVGTFAFLARRTLRQVEAIMASAQPELQNRNIEKAVDIIKGAYPLAKWQFLLQSQIDGQIGTIWYASQKFDKAEPYLRRSFKKNWVPRAMLATLLYKRKQFDEMKQVFEEAVQANKKQALLWNLYAYTLWKTNEREEAIKVLNRALEHVSNDEKTQRNLQALQNDRKMKMRGWNMQWYQFHLDKPPQPKIQIQGRRR